MIIWTKLSFFKLCFFASPPFQNISQILQKIFEFSSIMFWSDILRSIFDFISSHNNLRKIFICDFYISITIGSFQHIIERWLMLFDQIILQIKCFWFRFQLKKIHRFSEIEHFLFPNWVGIEVLRNPIFEIFCFSDIENTPLFIFELINSRLMWDMFYIKIWFHENLEKSF